MLIKSFAEKIKFGNPPESVKATLRYFHSASIDFTPATIQSAAMGNSLEISVMLKKMLLKGYPMKSKLIKKVLGP